MLLSLIFKGTCLSEVDEVYRNRWSTLLSVDEMVESVVIEKLQSLSLLNETYVIFISDHGYHMGTFALTIDKRMPYETGTYYTFTCMQSPYSQSFHKNKKDV